MCGRASLTASPEEIADVFGLTEMPELVARYNIAPTQPLPMVVGEARGARTLRFARFGLLPPWDKDVTSGAKHINARAETLLEKPIFAAAARQRRCLVAVDAFYEWKRGRAGAKNTPYRIAFAHGAPFALAGIWETTRLAGGAVVESCAIVTGPAKGAIAEVHDRMPLVVGAERFDAWLSKERDPAPWLTEMLERAPAFVATRVSTFVNDPRHEGPECAAPVNDGAPDGDGGKEPAGPARAAAPQGETLSLFGDGGAPRGRPRRKSP
ncbi:MAG: SOS response-associated peptidase [Myxococcales bacterium]|nr:SOS response-associated peptidase [Myxococcales bacterium]